MKPILMLLAPLVLGGLGHASPALATPAQEKHPAQGDPLQLAAEAVHRMPLRPHLKTRSRLQAELVQGALEGGRIELAKEWASGIANWRRGLALAHVAVHLATGAASDDDRAAARAAIRAAEAQEATITQEEDQGWRRDRVRVRIAEAYGHLGDTATAASISARATPTEGGRLSSMAARTVEPSGVERRMKVLESIASTGGMEEVRYALLAMAEFYGLPGLGDEQREGIEPRIRESWSKLPIGPRIDVLERLLELDVKASNHAKAKERAVEAQGLVTQSTWNPEQAVAMRARAAGLLFRAGSAEAALAQARDTLALYDASRSRIVDIFRGEALRPLGAVFGQMGDTETAAAVFGRALEESLQNPNSRPRATDLARTAIAASRVFGDAMPKALQRSFEQAAEAIGAPW